MYMITRVAMDAQRRVQRAEWVLANPNTGQFLEDAFAVPVSKVIAALKEGVAVGTVVRSHRGFEEGPKVRIATDGEGREFIEMVPLAGHRANWNELPVLFEGPVPPGSFGLRIEGTENVHAPGLQVTGAFDTAVDIKRVKNLNLRGAQISKDFPKHFGVAPTQPPVASETAVSATAPASMPVPQQKPWWREHIAGLIVAIVAGLVVAYIGWRSGWTGPPPK